MQKLKTTHTLRSGQEEKIDIIKQKETKTLTCMASSLATPLAISILQNWESVTVSWEKSHNETQK